MEEKRSVILVPRNERGKFDIMVFVSEADGICKVELAPLFGDTDLRERIVKGGKVVAIKNPGPKKMVLFDKEALFSLVGSQCDSFPVDDIGKVAIYQPMLNEIILKIMENGKERNMEYDEIVGFFKKNGFKEA